ncbi:MAG: metal ABC transporter substrate-binding protein, partial [Actinomycetota bacterium]
MKRLGLILAALALMAAGCSSAEPDGAEVNIVVTTTPLGDMVRNVVGDAATVDVLMPVGASPHAFQPSAKQVALIQRADLVVANGLGLEEGLTDVLEAAEADGVNVWEVGPDIGPRDFVEASGVDEHDEDGHDGGRLDPHFWLDPIKVAEATRLLASQLSELAPETDWSKTAEAYVEELDAVHSESTEMLSSIPVDARKLVTNHRSFGYFSDRYGFEMIGTVIPGGSELANPSS